MGWSPLRDLFGRKPDVPILPSVDIDKVQRDTVAGNAAVLPGAQAIAEDINTFNYDQALNQTRKALEFAMPGGFAKVQKIAGDQLAGEIPEDVQQQLLRTGASRAFASGTPGSIFSRNATLRDFGITSMAQQARGIETFKTLTSLSPKTTLFDLSSMLFNPQQRFAMTESERNAQYNRTWLEEQVAAAPHAMGQFVQNVVYAVAGTAGRYFGVAGAGGAGGGTGSGGGMSTGGGGGAAAY